MVKRSAISVKEMEQTRIARFDGLSLRPSMRKHAMPQEIADLVFSRKLFPVLSRSEADHDSLAPIAGAGGGFRAGYAVCDPGTGPGLHRHARTFETFTVMQGKFEFFWGEAGEKSIVLDRFDVVSIPPGEMREFRNIAAEDGILQVIVSGDCDDWNDVTFPASTRTKIAAADPDFVDFFENDVGIHFEN